MPTADDLVRAALNSLPAKDEGATQAEKKAYSELMSNVLAPALAEALRLRGCPDVRPSPPGESGLSGAERRLAGGIGAKKVDVSWATEESGLILGISVKTINWRDARTRNFQKNLTNRRNDMLGESVTLHRRYPFAVLAGLFALDKDARNDSTDQRKSTFENAGPRLRLFTGRKDPDGREEQLERLWVLLVDANPFNSQWKLYEADDLTTQVTFDQAIDQLLSLIVERNFDFYELDDDGHIARMRS